MIRILILANSKQPGGAEKSAIKLANALNQKYSITFGTLFQGRDDFYSSPNTLQVDFLKFSNLIRNLRSENSNSSVVMLQNPSLKFSSLIRSITPKFFRIFVTYAVLPLDFFLMRRKIKHQNFDLIISFGAGVGCVTYLSLLFSGIPQITSERISPDLKIYRPSLLARILRPWMYKHGVVCSVQSQGFKDTVKAIWGIESYITPNHFDSPASEYKIQAPSAPCVAVGRPAHQKGYDLLIAAWSILESKIQNELWIIADDADGYLQSLIVKNSVKNVHIKPLSENLYQLYGKCSLFISTSRFEGYPNAIAEAIMFGIPVVTTASSDVVDTWVNLGLCQIINKLEPNEIAQVVETSLKNTTLLESISKKSIALRSIFTWSNAEPYWENAINVALKIRPDTTL
jgi:glycosyltransferase involved in cell wall biosynthesis